MATLISTSLVTESECVVRCAERTVVSAVEFVSERVTRRVAHTVVSAVGFVSDPLDCDSIGTCLSPVRIIES